MSNPTNFVDDNQLGRLRDIYTATAALLTGTILAAGTNNIGDVDIASIAAGANRIGTVSGVLKTVSVTKALAAAGDYAAGEVLSESAGAGTAWTFAAIARANNASGYIVRAIALCQTTALTPRLTIFLFHTTPTCTLNDNAANTAVLWADRANFIGSIDFPAMEDLGTGVSQAIATPSTVGGLPLAFDTAAAADDLIGVVVTRDAITGESAGMNLLIALTVEQY